MTEPAEAERAYGEIVPLPEQTESQSNAHEALSGAMASLGMPSPGEWQAMSGMADQLSRSALVPSHLRNKPDDVMVVLLTARDLRIAPTMALGKIQVIEGKATLAAEMMAALVHRAGFALWPDPGNDRTKATAHAERAGRRMSFTFTLEDAVAANLVQLKEGKPFARSSSGKPLPWESYTQFMLWSRAVSGLCRQAFPDVLLGATYTPEELGCEVDGEGNVIDLPGDAYRPVSYVEPPKPETADEKAQRFGWANEADRMACQAILRQLRHELSSEAAEKVSTWRKGVGISDYNVAEQWVRVIGAASFFAANPDAEVIEDPTGGISAEPVVVQPRLDEMSEADFARADAAAREVAENEARRAAAEESLAAARKVAGR